MATSDDILAAIMQQMDIKTGPSHPLPSSTKSHAKRPEKKKIATIKRYQTSGSVFTKSEKSGIKNLLKSDGTYEIEASLGTFRGDSFQSGLKSLYCFSSIGYGLQNTVSMRQTKTLDRTDKIEGEHTRRITDLLTEDSVTYQKKYRRKEDMVNNTKWGIRVSKSLEVFEDDDSFDDRWNAKVQSAINEWEASDKKTSRIKQEIAVQRIRRRDSYTDSDRSGEFYGVRIDLSFVEEIHIRKDGSSYMIPKYEVEIERTETSIDVDAFISAVEKILMWSQNTSDPRHMIDLQERRVAVELHNHMFIAETSAKGWKTKDPYRLYSGYWNKPKNIKLKDMVEPKFDPWVTVKLDGRRNSLLFTDNGVYLFSPPYDVFKIGPPNDQLNGTLVDCEVLYDPSGDEVHGFDMLFDHHVDIRQVDFPNRYAALQKLGDDIENTELYNFNYLLKTYFVDGTFYDRVRQCIEYAEQQKEEEYPWPLDGMIFQPGHWYKNNHTFKWKPASQLTIDFLLVPLSREDIEEINPDEDPDYFIGRAFWLMAGENGKDVNFRGTRRHPFSGYAVFEDGELKGESMSYRIVECSWDSEYVNFVPDRFRTDRDRPNNLSTARDVWEDIMNPIPIETMEGDTLQLMRKYHNQEKLAILSKEFAKNSVILDIGSGRGGDLHKWDQLGFKTVYVVEPNTDNLDELQLRRETTKVKTQVHTMNIGAEQTQEISAVINKNSQILDGIVSFFSMTFFPQSKELYNGFIDTIDLLPEGGKFVGIVMDGYKVRDLLEETRYANEIPDDESVSYETKAYNITQASEFDDDIIGNTIEITLNDPSSMVKDQTEWLFYFEPFKIALEKKGFKLLHQGFLDKGSMFDMLPEQSRTLSSLFRAFVFQRVSTKGTKTPPKTKSHGVKQIKIDDMAPLSNPYGEDLFYVGVSSQRSGFIHSILRCISSEYYNMDRSAREAYALKIQRTIARKFTPAVFESLQDGKLAEKLSKPYMKTHKKKEALSIAYLEFKLKLMTGEEWAGETVLLELTSAILGIDIYILDHNKSSLRPSKRFAAKCNDGLYGHNKAIVLLNMGGLNYYPVAREENGEMYYVYDSSSEFIQKLYTQVCG